ncbi:MAPEG family protein [Brevundimonas sp. SL161]|uniref:MAPEG family protein n=1 Tax=Brevundimonas sp. SL161 TaxID=2804613 RepID=UPI003CF4CD85
MADMTTAQAAALWSGLMILLMIVLAIRVIMTRQKHGIGLGDGGQPELTVAGRTFGNCAVYVPVGVGALALLTLLGMPAYAVHAVGGVLFLGRLLHSFGLATDKVTLARKAGMGLTFLSLITAAGMLIVHAFIRGQPF